MDMKTKSSIQLMAMQKAQSGWLQTTIISYLHSKFPEEPVTVITDIAKNAKKTIETAYCIERDYVIGQHLERYNQEILDLLEGVKDEQDWKMFAMHFENLLGALNQKEELLGFHSRRFKVIIQNVYKNIEVKKKNVLDFKLDNLTLEEKIDLMNLLDKAKTKLNK